MSPLVLPLACTTCGRPAMAARPGTAEVRELFLLQAGEPLRAWCFACWCSDFAMHRGYNGNARQVQLPGVRTAGRISHPAIALGACGDDPPSVPVDQRKLAWTAVQAAHSEVTGEPVPQGAGFPTS